MPTADPPPLLTLSGVSRRYGERHALLPIDLTVAAGWCVAVLGANGSGKSTLLRIAAGRDTPSTGLVSYAGHRLTADDPVVRTEIAVVGDMVSAYPDLTVREHLLLVAVAHGAGRGAGSLADRALQGVPPGRSRRRAAAARCPAASSRRCTWPRCWSGRAGCWCWTSRSSGWTRRPAAGWRACCRPRSAAGAALLVATHHAELAAAVADHVIVLSDGAVTAEGRPEVALAELR